MKGSLLAIVAVLSYIRNRIAVGFKEFLPMPRKLMREYLQAPEGLRLRAQHRRDRAKAMYTDGLSQSQIADAIGVTQARVSQILADPDRDGRRTYNRHMLRLPPERATP
jgi:hypothetical protein